MKLYYVYDALCGWCYGFSPVIKKFYNKVQDQLPLEVISGGMMLGDREGPMGKVAPYIKDKYKVVEDRTGVKFGAGFLNKMEEGQMHISSYPPAKAMAAFKMMKDVDQLSFAHAIQQAIYYDGLKPEDIATYIKAAEELKINIKTFTHHYKSAVTEELVLQDFHLAKQLEVKGFPSVFIEEDYNFILLTHGYTSEKQLHENFEKGKKMLLAKREK